MDQRELTRAIRLIRIRTSKVVDEVFAGQYESVFRGRGIEFDEVREYQPGDDIRSIDWNVTARMGHPYIKRYVEERELTVMLAVDLSASQRFGTRRRMKSELAAEICCVLALAAVRNNDKVGMLMFSDRVERFVPPRKGLTHSLRIVRDALSYEPVGKGTDLASALEYIARVTTKRIVLFILSDFHDWDYANQLRVLAKRHDVIAIRIHDPVETSIPKAGLIELSDAETGERYLLDTKSKAARTLYLRLARERRKKRRSMLNSAGIDQIDLATNESYMNELIRFFRLRERRLVRTG